jgi:hypothetical protein
MLKAQEAEPTNLEVLLSLGVSHTNELEQQEALGYLRAWLQNHPRYGKLVPQDGSAEGLGHNEVRLQAFLGPRNGMILLNINVYLTRDDIEGESVGALEELVVRGART